MTIDERLEYIATLQQAHDEQIGRLVEQGQENSRGIAALKEHEIVIDRQMEVLAQRMTVLTERTIQAMDSINRLGRIADSHEDRIVNLEDQRPS